MRIKKIHRVIRFEQPCWTKPCIDLNIEERKEAVRKDDNVGKDLFNLFNDAVFGKTMENLRKRIKKDCIEADCKTKLANVQKDFVKIWLAFTSPKRYWY